MISGNLCTCCGRLIHVSLPIVIRSASRFQTGQTGTQLPAMSCAEGEDVRSEKTVTPPLALPQRGIPQEPRSSHNSDHRRVPEPILVCASHRVRDTIVFFGSPSLRPEKARAKLAAVEKAIEQRARLGAEAARFQAEQAESSRAITRMRGACAADNRMFQRPDGNNHLIVCSGGSGGMMEAANRGASMARR